MLSFGFLTLNRKIERSFFTEIAKRAHTYSIDVFCFSPGDIDPKTELVNGEKFNFALSRWENTIFPIPNYLYDRCFYSSENLLQKYAPIVNWLKNRPNTTFIGYGLPNKWILYQLLSEHQLLNYYIPPTTKVQDASEIFKLLDKNSQVILKPVNGSQGKGILLLTQTKDGIELQTHQNKKIIKKKFAEKQVATAWFKKLLSVHSYLLQPFLPLHDCEQRCFDIRIFLQKTENNQWTEIGRGIRKAQPGFFVSNLHSGGSIHSFESWLKTIGKQRRVLIIDEINTIITHLPDVLEQSFGPLFELGIDIGIASDGTIWLLDINSKPGHKTILEINEALKDTLFNAPLIYCRQLEFQRS